jgi:hypothetical protein
MTLRRGCRPRPETRRPRARPQTVTDDRRKLGVNHELALVERQSRLDHPEPEDDVRARQRRQHCRECLLVAGLGIGDAGSVVASMTATDKQDKLDVLFRSNPGARGCAPPGQWQSRRTHGTVTGARKDTPGRPTRVTPARWAAAPQPEEGGLVFRMMTLVRRWIHQGSQAGWPGVGPLPPYAKPRIGQRRFDHLVRAEEVHRHASLTMIPI